ncbi:hypothetical protein [Treponema putidum]|uniref:hypothetical protein n=1 Tax=Treponema putidum TaxID=221027 RepID=UPI002104BB53|nr:hypothetical protein [Treponema putidum]
MKKYFFGLAVFIIIVSTLFTGCETLESGKGEKQPYFSEKNEQKFLRPEQQIRFTTEGLSEKIQFTKDGKRLMLPVSYQEAEKLFGFDEEEIESLNSDSYDKLWIRMNKVLNTNKKPWPWDAAETNDWGGNVLYILYLADFINIYEDKAPSVVDMTNAPDWFKEVLAYRKTVPNYGKTEKELNINTLNAKVIAGNKEVVVSWTTNKYLKGVIIERFDDSYYNNPKKVTITDGSTKYVFKDLQNLQSYEFKISFADNSGEVIKEIYWLRATPRSGDKNKDYIKGTSDFVNAKYELLLPETYKIDYYYGKSVNKILFSEDGTMILVPNKFLKGENIFDYTKEEMEYDEIFWTRMEKVLKTENKHHHYYASIAGENGNVLWLLYCADFLNIYQKKLPGMVDLSNAPDWFKTLMEQRKNSPDSYVKDEYK